MKTNFFYALENITPSKKLRRIILSLTSLCNSRCKTCGLWKNKKRIEPSLEDLTNLAKSSFFKSIKFLSLTGGEPFLRKDIVEIINLFKKENPRLNIEILTNALLPDLIYKKVKQMSRDVTVTFSFNGDEKTHDLTRGVKGNFQKLLKSIECMKKLGQKNNLIFTITKENYNQLIYAWNFAKKHNLNILFNPEMDYQRLNRKEKRTLTKEQAQKVLEQLKIIYSQRKRFFFDDTYLFYFKKFYSQQQVADFCYAGTNSIFINCDGNIYPCENLVGISKPLGNLKDKNFTPQDYTKNIQQIKCYKNCFLECEMVRNLRKHPLKTMWKLHHENT